MGLRTGYGTGSYGAHKYGLPQVITGQAVATATVTSTAVGKYVYGGQEYDERLRDGYGVGRYGRGLYGQSTLDKGAAAVSVTSVVSQADAERVRPFGAASTTATVTTTTVGVRIHQGQSTATPTVTTAAQGFYSATGAATATPTVAPNITYLRIRPFEATEACTSEVTQKDARYKWIPVTDPSDTWTEAPSRSA
tara:strand:+ start:1121 stop:1702 length:582 start_codon:yes stop_codon:yes gene_type:complete